MENNPNIINQYENQINELQEQINFLVNENSKLDELNKKKEKEILGLIGEKNELFNKTNELNDLLKKSYNSQEKKMNNSIRNNMSKNIDNQEILKNNQLQQEIKSKKKKIKKQKKEDIEIFLDENPPDIILSEDFILCNHKKLEEIECLILKNRKVIPSHSHDIKEFIQKFSDNPWGIDRLNIDKKPKDIIINEIQKGTRNSQIYRTIDDYMTLIKKRIKKKGEKDRKKI